MPRTIACQVVTPTGVVFDAQVAGVKGPGFLGGFEVLGRHAPYMVRLERGRVSLVGEQDEELFALAIEGGFLTVAGDRCTVLVEKLPTPPAD